MSDPKILIATCMKDEGPFILEWLSWQIAVGVTDFVVFTNDCSDGTDAILDHLDARGIVTHLPNPATVLGSAKFQPIALEYAQLLPVFAKSDYFISMDVDEFINVRVGDGRLTDLFDAAGPFDALSMSEINHGANGREDYEPGWMTQQFPRHQSETPGPRKARRGVKTIVRLSDRLLKARNHRPDFHPELTDVVWLDGSARPRTEFLEDDTENGFDARGTYDLVSLDHFALRSLSSYLMKMLRGDVVVKDKQVSQRYWRLRNGNDAETSDLTRMQGPARDVYDDLFAGDAELMALQAAAETHHSTQIAELLKDPLYIGRREWIMGECWP